MLPLNPFSDFGEGLTYNVRADEPANVSETSEGELDQAFNKTPSEGSAADDNSPELENTARQAKKSRDKEVQKDIEKASEEASTSTAPKPTGSGKTTKKAGKAAESLEKMKSQLSEARKEKLRVTISLQPTAVVTDVSPTAAEKKALKRKSVVRTKFAIFISYVIRH